ncbi:DUF4402 domain-containing protein [Roseateles sp.]|uniref:DUF4402 domain-containing protein n=1 Tax=Roseateles sp. TaxID=1971397 RepID=UPI00286BE8E1|nr:DUF4402 domain-containing protein [Roseateles sp.]
MQARLHIRRRGLALASAAILAFSVDRAAAQNVVRTAGLSFGSFLAGHGGSVQVSSNGRWSKSGGVILLGQGSGAAAAQFIITGSSGAGYTIGLPADHSVLLTSANGHSLAVNGFIASLNELGPTLKELRIGASLNVGANQAAGTYSGNYNITVEYQ